MPEWATLRKLWRQTGFSSLLPAKCLSLLHVIRPCSWRLLYVVAGISARFAKFSFVLFCCITIAQWLVPWGTVNFVSLEFLSGNKIHCYMSRELNIFIERPGLTHSSWQMLETIIFIKDDIVVLALVSWKSCLKIPSYKFPGTWNASWVTF